MRVVKQNERKHNKIIFKGSSLNFFDLFWKGGRIGIKLLHNQGAKKNQIKKIKILNFSFKSYYIVEVVVLVV